MMNDSEALFTFWQNTSSDHDNQTEQEFPQWQPVVSLLLLSLWLLSVSLATLLSFSVLLAVVMSSFNKKLGMVATYLHVGDERLSQSLQDCGSFKLHTSSHPIL